MRHPALAALLARLPSLANAAASRATPVADPELAMTSCRVERQGDAGGGILWQAQRRGFDPLAPGHGDIFLSVTVMAERGVAIAWTEPHDGWAARPRRLADASGTWLHLPVEGAGSAGRSLDEVWRRAPGQAAWRRVAVDGWQAGAMAALHPHERLSPAWRLELARMRVTGAVTREGDPGCCPGGGRIMVWLVLRKDRLELRQFRRR